MKFLLFIPIAILLCGCYAKHEFGWHEMSSHPKVEKKGLENAPEKG